MTTSPDLTQLYRAESGRIIAALVMVCKDFTMAEDAFHDACIQAVEQWSQHSAPENKTAWLFTVARRRLIDRIRKESHRKSQQIQQQLTDMYQQDDHSTESDEEIPDERLRLIFTCCHPALVQDAQVALTLKTLCGLTIREIARAYLISEVAMTQRLVRAKRKIEDAGISYVVPEGEDLTQRLSSVLSTIYLIYNESYSAYEGQSLTREDLANEAIRLARVLYTLLPEPPVAGLLALILLHDARRKARQSKTQEFIPLEFQDRSLWDQQKIKQGTDLVLTSLARGRPDPYQIEAAISALHSTSKSWQQTDWKQIHELYQVLYELKPSPIVALNLNVAKAFKGEIKSAFKALLDIEKDLKDYQPFYVAKAEILSMLSRKEQALDQYRKAINLSQNQAEKQFLTDKAKKLKDTLKA